MVSRFPTESIVPSINTIHATVSGLNLSQSLRFLTTVSKYQFEHNRPAEETADSYITSWFTVYLAKELLLRATDNSDTELDVDSLKSLSRNFAVADSGYLEARPFSNEHDKLRRLILLHYERRLWIEPIKSVLARLYFTLYEAPFPSYDKYRTAWASKFRELNGIDFPAFFRVAMGIFWCLFNRGCLDRRDLTDAKDPKLEGWFTDKNIDAVLSLFTCTVDEFRVGQRRAQQTNSPIQSLYEFNYLRRKPLVRNDQGEILAPSPLLIADRISTGVHYDIIDKLKSEGRDFRYFTTDFGKLFEGYIGKLLNEFYQLGTELVNADDCFPKKKAKFGICDWIIFEENAVILIECKAAKVPLDLLVNPNVIKFRDFIIKRYLNDGKTQFKHLFEHFSDQGKRVYSLIVYNDYISFYNDYDLILFDKPEVVRNLSNYRAAFASVYDFEKTLPLLRHVRLSDILERKWADPELRKNDLSNTAEMYSEFSTACELETVSQVWSDVFGVMPTDGISSRDE